MLGDDTTTCSCNVLYKAEVHVYRNKNYISPKFVYWYYYLIIDILCCDNKLQIVNKKHLLDLVLGTIDYKLKI